MEKHSFWTTLSSLLANLHSKFVKHGKYVIRGENGEVLLTVSTRLPYVISDVNVLNGEIQLTVTKGGQNG